MSEKIDMEKIKCYNGAMHSFIGGVQVLNKYFHDNNSLGVGLVEVPAKNSKTQQRLTPLKDMKVNSISPTGLLFAFVHELYRPLYESPISGKIFPLKKVGYPGSKEINIPIRVDSGEAKVETVAQHVSNAESGKQTQNNVSTRVAKNSNRTLRICAGYTVTVEEMQEISASKMIASDVFINLQAEKASYAIEAIVKVVEEIIFKGSHGNLGFLGSFSSSDETPYADGLTAPTKKWDAADKFGSNIVSEDIARMTRELGKSKVYIPKVLLVPNRFLTETKLKPAGSAGGTATSLGEYLDKSLASLGGGKIMIESSSYIEKDAYIIDNSRDSVFTGETESMTFRPPEINGGNIYQEIVMQVSGFHAAREGAAVKLNAVYA